jgi:hypothetical protein
LHQTGDGTLDGISHLLKKFADMTGMIGLGKLLRDDLRDQRGGPDPGIEPGGDRAAVD